MELLAPAGNVEKLRFCYAYGADAAYIGLKNFSLRVKADNFYEDEYKQVAALKKAFPQKKLYCALNILFHNSELDRLVQELPYFKCYPIDAFIVQDLGIVPLLQKEFPNAALHLSTQASCINREAVKMYRSLGFSRVVLGREASLAEIAEIKNAVPDMELECFVHGAMCIAYSGRCLMSAYVNGRSGQSGFCSHTCRWDYDVLIDPAELPGKFRIPDGSAQKESCTTQNEATSSQSQNTIGLHDANYARTLSQSGAMLLRERQRPDEYFPVYEGEQFTAVLSSKDLCMVEHLADLKKAGVDSLKIEGRMKSVYYVAIVTQAYRKALDELNGTLLPGEARPFVQELYNVSHRPFSTGFFYNRTEADVTTHGESHSPWQLAALCGSRLSDQAMQDILRKGTELQERRHAEYSALIPKAQQAWNERAQTQPDRYLPAVQEKSGWNMYQLEALNMIEATTELQLVLPGVASVPFLHEHFLLVNPGTGEVYRWVCAGHPCVIYTDHVLSDSAILRSHVEQQL
ncbi:MAG: U32 family peptidase [Treponema sp.]|nr:U32 family peptidase [Treponema sp.]